MRVMVVIGANGQLGTDLIRALGEWKSKQGGRNHDLLHSPASDFYVVPLAHKDIEICNHTLARDVLTQMQPDVVINTAAYHRVDDCEDNPEQAFRVNAIAVRNLALVCQKLNALLVHISTDYVFGGERNRCTPYSEADLPWPVNVYGASKLSGENFVRSLCPRHLIVRTSGLYGTAGSTSKGGNFVELMLRLAREGRSIRVVHDQRLAPTFTADLAGKIADLIVGEHYGLYHIVNDDSCSWHEFATAIFELSGQSPQLSSTTTEEYGARADRPRYSVLTSQKLSNIDIDALRAWPDALAAYMKERP